MMRYPSLSLVATACLLLSSAAQAEDYTSYTEPNRSIEISAAEAGIIQDVFVKEGQAVKAGEVLARLDMRGIQQQVDIAREEADSKKKRLDKLQELFTNKFASQEEVEHAQSDVIITELKFKLTEELVERRTLRSPIDGIVTEMRFDVSESVGGANSHVATVVQVSPLRVQFNLKASDARRHKPGDELSLYFPDINTTGQGKLEFISPVTTAVVNTVRVTMVIPATKTGLTAGMQCIYRSEESQPLTNNNNQTK
ncbi:hypothetical protein BH11VER1_BH11VER1_25360 [soil metagenome]